MKMIIAVEGGDMVGKATQTARLAKRMRECDIKVITAEVPFAGGAFYQTIYDMLESGAARRWPILFQTLHAVNKLSCQLALLRADADAVVFDRWHMSSMIYGIASGLPRWLVRALGAVLVRPDLTIVLDRCDKLTRDEASDSYERDTEMQRHVKQMYADACDGVSVVRVDASGTVEEVAARVSRAVIIRAAAIGAIKIAMRFGT